LVPCNRWNFYTFNEHIGEDGAMLEKDKVFTNKKRQQIE